MSMYVKVQVKFVLFAGLYDVASCFGVEGYLYTLLLWPMEKTSTTNASSSMVQRMR